jgi:hypothetical protein
MPPGRTNGRGTITDASDSDTAYAHRRVCDAYLAVM